VWVTRCRFTCELLARLCGVAEDGRDGTGIVELPGGDADHQVVDLAVRQDQTAAVKAVERDDAVFGDRWSSGGVWPVRRGRGE
jgi:hypothetical protein